MRSVLIKTLLFAFLAFLLGACSSVQPRQERKNEPSPIPDSTAEPALDILGLQRSLAMDRAEDDLGYAEKAFNSCEAGYGFSSTHDCRQLYLVVIHFQLQCRGSEGTETSADYSVRPIITDRLRWSLGSGRGVAATSAEGYGHIRWITPSSQKRQKLRLTYNGQFLILTAEDVRRIVTPGSWCEN